SPRSDRHRVSRVPRTAWCGASGSTSPSSGAFRRRDQLRWAGVYLQGLLVGGQRSNAEGLASRVVLPPEQSVEDVAQALQNFVNQSPWDEEGLWRRYRALLAPRLAGPDGVFVVEDVTFPKQGQRSVGVHRQFSRGEGRK